jgi:hypothetical protein
MFAEHGYNDICGEWTSPCFWYQWYYDSKLQLLLLLPDPSSMPKIANVLWLKILKACDLKDWLDLFSGQDNHVIQQNRMMLHSDGVNQLIEYYKPKKLWLIGNLDVRSLITKDCQVPVLYTNDYLEWQTQAIIKKQIWQNWLALKN